MHTPPSHFATAPVDTGKGFSKPLRSLRASRFAHFSSNPPVTSRQPLRGTGKGFTEPLRSLRSESRDFVGIIYNSIPNLRLCQRSRWRSWRPGWRK